MSYVLYISDIYSIPMTIPDVKKQDSREGAGGVA